MTKEEKETVVAIFTALQTATINLAVLLSKHTGVDKRIVAESFISLAEKSGHAFKNRDVISVVLKQIAMEIELSGSERANDAEENIRRVFH